MNTLYPVFMKLEHRPVLVLGGGSVAEQKIRGLMDARASITVIAPELNPFIESLNVEGKIEIRRRAYRSGDVRGFSIVIGATGDPAVQQAIYDDSQAFNIPVNIVDVPDLCTFFSSSAFQKGDLKIAVSTNGKSPTLGKFIRDKIQEGFSDGYPEVLETLGSVRSDVQACLPDYESRKQYFAHIVKSEVERLRRHTADRLPHISHSQTGKVFLVGAGPGDPDLITVKGQRILQSAEVILYDALLDDRLLEKAPGSCEKIYVGKRADAHCLSQDKINRMLIDKAKQGKRVVRLKGGDPLIFGRGGEEIEALVKEGVEVEVVPGITSGTGVPGTLGIPLTHRNHSSSVVFVSGHQRSPDPQAGIDWSAIARIDTIVVYMGIKNIDMIVDKLVRNGAEPATPVAVVFDGTSARSYKVNGTLNDIVDKIRNLPLDIPGIIIVGDVVGFLNSSRDKAEFVEARKLEKRSDEKVEEMQDRKL